MSNTPTPPNVETPAAAAGRWMAHAARFLVSHPNYMVWVRADSYRVAAGAASLEADRLTAHARLHHQAVFDPGALAGMYPNVPTGFDARIALECRHQQVSLSGHVQTPYGGSDFALGLTDGWLDAAHLLALLCLAFGGTTAFHQALLWAVLGGGGQDVLVYPASLDNRIARAMATIADPMHYELTTGMAPPPLRLPHLQNTAEHTRIARWLHTAVGGTRDAASAAFEQTRAAHSNPTPLPLHG